MNYFEPINISKKPFLKAIRDERTETPSKPVVFELWNGPVDHFSELVMIDESDNFWDSLEYVHFNILIMSMKWGNGLRKFSRNCPYTTVRLQNIFILIQDAWYDSRKIASLYSRSFWADPIRRWLIPYESYVSYIGIHSKYKRYHQHDSYVGDFGSRFVCLLIVMCL